MNGWASHLRRDALASELVPYDVLPTANRAVLGEGPWWSVSDQTLTWVDIPARSVHRSRLDGSRAEQWETPEDVGFAVPNTDGLLLIGLRSGLHWLDPRTGSIWLDESIEQERFDHRINDGKTDRAGCVWFGTMHDAETQATGALYRADSRGTNRVLDGITTSNGLGWSPDGTVMYHTDSMTHSIRAYPFDTAAGVLGAGAIFAVDPPGYVPDGLTVDANGFVWSAKWNGGVVVRYAPDGRVDRELRLPVSRPTSCMFVGSDLRTLAVTSARPDVNSQEGEPLAGSVFLMDVGVAGIPEVVATRKTSRTTPIT